MSAEEAATYGLVDKVIENRTEIEPEKPKKKK